MKLDYARCLRNGFDRVQRDLLSRYLEEKGLDTYDLRILNYLYFNQAASRQYNRPLNSN